MSPASAHTALLLLSCLAALAATIVSAMRRGAPDAGRGVGGHVLSPARVIRALWPFAALACFEALQMRISGMLIAEWLLPALITPGAVLFASSPRSVRWIRRAMIATALVLTLHGGLLLARGYVARPRSLPPGWRAERRWYTPFIGIMPVERPG